ncbi:unnamed protein product [Bathycoccus prasinos]
MMQPNHANMDNLQCFNSLIFNSSKSPDSAKPNGSDRQLDRAHRGPGSRERLDQRGQGLRLLLNGSLASF